ncbi:hypothetical protein ABZV65_28755 [Streptomyces bauhiniae]|uniref:hypothetical protein n=1 Tax=Streptomyces bauhiniae TaxID=2340725 RepID=UPI0033B46F94
MSLLPWRVLPLVGSSRDGMKEPGHAEVFPGVPVQVEFGIPGSTEGPWQPRTTYSSRDDVPAANQVTRQLAGVMHARVDRIGQARDLLGRWQDRTLGRQQRTVRQLPDIAGDRLAKWTLDHVLTARQRPVPSFGFGLAPVLTHGVAAQRQRWLRGLLLVAVAVLIAGRHPWGAATLAGIAALYPYLIASGAVGALLRWGLGALVPMLVLAVGAFLVWTQFESHADAIRFAVQDTVSAGVWLILLTTAVYTVDGWIVLAYMASLRASRERLRCRPRFAPRAAARIAQCEAAESWQGIPYRMEGTHRFVGAGRDAWRPGGPRIQLVPTRLASDGDEGPADGPVNEGGSDGIRKFEADELLDRVREELERLAGTLVETHALPNCDVFEALAVPESRWKKLPRVADRSQHPGGSDGKVPWPEAEEMLAEARRAPSGHESRRYLAAQVVDWQGQVVVTVFAHAALEGKTLHFITRPHVLAPLKGEVRNAPAEGWALVGKIVLAPVHALGDTVALAHASYGVLLRALSGLVPGVLGRAMRERMALTLDSVTKEDPGPVSLREHCGLVSPEDMHQAEDVARHISILQSRMFSTVSAFLTDHGVATGEFKRQAAEFVTKVFISGDNNQVNTGTVHGGQTQSGVSDGAPAKG